MDQRNSLSPERVEQMTKRFVVGQFYILTLDEAKDMPQQEVDEHHKKIGHVLGEPRGWMNKSVFIPYEVYKYICDVTKKIPDLIGGLPLVEDSSAADYFSKCVSGQFYKRYFKERDEAMKQKDVTAEPQRQAAESSTEGEPEKK